MTIQQAKNQFTRELDSSPTPRLDVEALMCHILGLTKTELLLSSSRELAPSQQKSLQNAVQKRSTGLPVAYITGTKEFFGYDFFVTPAVLIPKPDTEILVENAIKILRQRLGSARNTGRLSVCDMCTGSGCIALSVARQLLETHTPLPQQLPEFTLADLSQDALEIAKKNALRLFPSYAAESDSGNSCGFSFIQTDLFSGIHQSFDVILTNPPYIPSKMVDALLQDGRGEPRLALDGDLNSDSGDGLGIIRRLLPQAAEHLKKNGIMLMETGEYNASAAAGLAQELGFKTKTILDLEGQPRVTVIARQL